MSPGFTVAILSQACTHRQMRWEMVGCYGGRPCIARLPYCGFLLRGSGGAAHKPSATCRPLEQEYKTETKFGSPEVATTEKSCETPCSLGTVTPVCVRKRQLTWQEADRHLAANFAGSRATHLDTS